MNYKNMHRGSANKNMHGVALKRTMLLRCQKLAWGVAMWDGHLLRKNLGWVVSEKIKRGGMVNAVVNCAPSTIKKYQYTQNE